MVFASWTCSAMVNTPLSCAASTRSRTFSCRALLPAMPCISEPSIFAYLTGNRFSNSMEFRPAPKCSRARLQPRESISLANLMLGSICCATSASVTWNTSLPAATSLSASCLASQSISERSTSESLDKRTKTRSGFLLLQKDRAAPMTQRSMGFISLLRWAAGRKSLGSIALSSLSSMRTSKSKIACSSPPRLAIG